MSNIADDAAAVSAATTGPDTPNEVNIKRPTRIAQWVQVGASVAMCVFAGLIIFRLAFMPWPRSEALLLELVRQLGLMGLACIVCLAIIALSQYFTRVEAGAGPGRVAVS